MTTTRLRVHANGLEHNVLEWSTHSREERAVSTVVLVHGFMDAAGTWDLVAPSLAAAGFRVLAPHMRGFGDGARAPAGSYYHFADYVFDLADIVDQLSPPDRGEAIALVGHSMGGTIATLLAGTFPERFARLALIEGVGPPDNPWETAPLRMRRWIQQVRTSRTRSDGRLTFTREEALMRMAGSHPNLEPELLAHRLPHLAEDAGQDRLAWQFDPLHRTTAPTPFFAKSFVEFARKVTCPVLFVSGGPQGYHPPDEEDRLAMFATCARAEVANAGHMVHWTEPEALSKLLLAHLA